MEIDIYKFISIFILINTIFFSCPHAFAIEERAFNSWSKNLLFFGKQSLVAKGSPFFISSNGYKDPLAELNASLELFRKPEQFIKQNKGHPECIYPARYHFLKSHFNFKDSQVKCPALEKWLEQVRGDEIAIVYASQFVSNPASVMGHTFLHIIDKNNPDFLNTSLGYAAQVPKDEGPFSYAYNGLTGGYPGIFFENPFYEKIHEYSNMEQRDVWEYHLALTQDEKLLFLYLLWELRLNANFDYYFLNENCSFLLVALVEAVTGKDLTSGYGIYIAPYLTVQKLNEEGLIQKESFRPSLRTKLKSQFSHLDQIEKKAVLDSWKKKKILKTVNEPVVVEALMTNLLYKKNKQEGYLSKKDKSYLEELMVKRSTQPVFEENEILPPESPLNSHRPKFLDYRLGSKEDGGNFQSLTLRPGIHQYMDKPAGFLSNSAFSFLEGEFSYFSEDGSLFWERLTIFNLVNINPYFILDPRISYKVKSEVRRRDLLCQECSIFNFEFLLGGSVDLLKRETLNFFIGIEEQASRKIKHGHQPWGKFELELIEDFDSQRLRLSQALSYPLIHCNDLLKVNYQIEYRYFDVFDHVHLGIDLKHAFFVSGEKSFFDFSFVSSYDF